MYCSATNVSIPHIGTISVPSLPHTYILQALELETQINIFQRAVLTDRVQLLNTVQFCHSGKMLLQLEKKKAVSISY